MLKVNLRGSNVFSYQAVSRCKPYSFSIPQESQKIFKAEHPMENTEATKTKLIGYGFQLLEGRLDDEEDDATSVNTNDDLTPVLRH